MLTNDRIMRNNCDNITDANATANPSTENAINMTTSDANTKSSSSSTEMQMEADKDERTVSGEKRLQNNKTSKTRRLHLQRSATESSLKSCCSYEEEEEEVDADDKTECDFEFAYESDREEERGEVKGEQDDDIFYDSTNENENSVNISRETTNCAAEDECDLSKLYLNDIKIDSKDEEETVTELVDTAKKDELMQVEESKTLRVSFGVILRLLYPLANGVVQGIKGIRDVRFLRVMRSIASSRQILTNLFAFAANTISLNLSSVQVSHRIEPILKLLKIRKSRDGIESLPDSPTTSNAPDVLIPPASPYPTNTTFSPFAREVRYSLPNVEGGAKKLSTIDECVATQFCSLNILAEPPPGQPIRADIVFIHGLHGSLANTWKQGLWENERKPVEFERPPKPPVRPPKRPRHSRSSAVHPLHHKKRARFANVDERPTHSFEPDYYDELEENEYSFVCGEPRDIQICDGIEYSFPTFRLRVNDNGRLLQAELQDAINKETQTTETIENSSEDKEQNKSRKPSKPSPNDPNYSKCWPGDWLPIDCPGVRVMALNYTTDQHLWRPLWKKKEYRTNLVQRSREMTELLIKHRVGYGHPIIWVGHSKGGLFIKQIIVDAWESGRPAAAPFWRSARGVFFYSVPHRGSHLASIKAPLLIRSVELIDIEKNSKYLLDLHRRFAGLYHLGHLKIEVFSFVETALTLMSVLYMRIVGVDSADPGIGDVCGIRLDHREICKPRSRDCILYKQLVDMINKVC